MGKAQVPEFNSRGGVWECMALFLLIKAFEVRPD